MYLDDLKQIIRTDLAHPSVYNDILLDKLNTVEFTFTIPLDKNRAHDGLYLRRKLGYESNDPCTMLEMMIALAVRIEDEFLGDTSTESVSQTGVWFGEMVDSLGLTNCDSDEEFYFIMDRFFAHEYEPNGLGSLFYTPTATDDFRYLQIWDQMGAWIVATRL